jgi:2-polyprenyl-3-methyl-5-hydroxy-6-metoxy-1,4-benzoquinol methylase
MPAGFDRGYANRQENYCMKEPVLVREQVISANVEFYKDIAKKYDNYEACASEEYFQHILEFDVEKMESLLTNHDIHCLDCGGGSGNLTLKMLKRGWAVTVVDVSPDMLEISKAKVASHGYKAEFVNDSIEHFLADSERVFDVITFSSVLHHLYTPLKVVNDIANRVKAGGFFYSNFDPVLPSSRLLATCFYNLDTILAKMHNDRSDLLPGIGRRLRKFFIGRDSLHSRSIASPGDLAEYHARVGLDDISIERTLEQNGFIVERERYAAARTKLMQVMNRYLHATLSFKILAQRKVVDGGSPSDRNLELFSPERCKEYGEPSHTKQSGCF